MISAQSLKLAVKSLDFLGLTFDEDEYVRVADNLFETQKFQRDIYQDSWLEIMKIIDRLINEKNGDLGAIVTQLFDPVPNNPISPVSEGILLSVFKEFKIPYDLLTFQETPGKRLVAKNGRYALIDKSHIDFTVVDCVLEHLSEDVDCLAEFGSGWGGNLIRAMMGSGRLDINYIACEQAESGRHCFDNLFGLVNGIKFSSHEFDFYSPRFDMIEGHHHILAFTCAAIEQIAFLPPSFFNDIFNMAEKVTLIFFEPIGWQRSIKRSRFYLKSYFDELGGKKHPVLWHRSNFVYKFDNENFLENAMSWALRSRYNINLLSLIKSCSESKKAKLTRLDYDIYSGNPLNPYSLVVLKKC